MYIVNGIAYAENNASILRVVNVRPMDNYFMWIKFSNGEERIFNFTSMLEKPAFMPLKDINLFKQVYIDYGVPVWNNGDIDISPEFLYENSQTAD